MGKVPDKSAVLTIFSTSVSREARAVLKKLVGNALKQHVDEFRFVTIFSRVSALTGLSVDDLVKLLLRLQLRETSSVYAQLSCVLSSDLRQLDCFSAVLSAPQTIPLPFWVQ